MSTRKRANTRSKTAAATVAAAASALAATSTSSQPELPNLISAPSTSAFEIITSTTASTTASNRARGNKRKSTLSMENLHELAGSSTSLDTTGTGDSGLAAGVAGDNRRTIDRLLATSAIYLKCAVLCYDAKLHQTLDKIIDQLETLELDVEKTPDELLPTITGRHLELINQRMKLIQMKPSETGQSLALQGATATTTPIDIDLSAICFYCKADHPPECCTVYPLNRRSNIIKKRKRCFRCLAKKTEDHSDCPGRCRVCTRAHHVSLCKQDPATYVRKVKEPKEPKPPSPKVPTPPVEEPELPQNVAQLLTVPGHINHPKTLECTHSGIIYGPTFAAKVVTPSSSATGRVYLNKHFTTGSFVSPAFLARLGVTPLKLSRPIKVAVQKVGQTMYSSLTTTAYTILELRSAYRPSYRFKTVFYVLDLSHIPVEVPSEAVVKLAEERGVKLSLTFDEASSAGNSTVDLFMGRQQATLTGYDIGLSVVLADSTATNGGLDATAFYTHFGYVVHAYEAPSRRGGRGGTSNAAPGTTAGAGPSRSKRRNR